VAQLVSWRAQLADWRRGFASSLDAPGYGRIRRLADAPSLGADYQAPARSAEPCVTRMNLVAHSLGALIARPSAAAIRNAARLCCQRRRGSVPRPMTFRQTAIEGRLVDSARLGPPGWQQRAAALLSPIAGRRTVAEVRAVIALFGHTATPRPYACWVPRISWMMRRRLRPHLGHRLTQDTVTPERAAGALAASILMPAT